MYFFNCDSGPEQNYSTALYGQSINYVEMEQVEGGLAKRCSGPILVQNRLFDLIY